MANNHRNRSAITGRFINDAAANRWPKTSVRETIKPQTNNNRKPDTKK